MSEDKDSEVVFNWIGKAVLVSVFTAISFPFFIAPLMILDGWALIKLWGWFVQPFGLPALGLWHAIGLSLIISFLTKQHAHDERKISEKLGYMVARPLFFVLIGYVVHLIGVK